MTKIGRQLGEVENVKKILYFLFICALFFSFDIRAFADAGHSHDHENMEDMIDQFKSGTQTNEQEDHSNHSSTTDHSESESSHENHSVEDSHSSVDTEATHSHGPVIETPPNYKVLGTYGAINLSFILIGIWNKWFRRKEE